MTMQGTALNASNWTDSTKNQFLSDRSAVAFMNRLPVVLYLSLVSVVGTLGNILVILVYWLKYPPCSTRVYILAMALLDLFTSAVALPLQIVTIRYASNSYSCMVCRCLLAFTMLSTQASGLLLIPVAIDRFRKVCRPMGYQLNDRENVMVAVGTVLLSWVIFAPFVPLYGIRKLPTPIPGLQASMCWVDERYKSTVYPVAYSIVISFVFFGTFTIMSVLYGIIGLTVRNRGPDGKWRSAAMITSVSQRETSIGYIRSISTKSTSARDYSACEKQSLRNPESSKNKHPQVLAGAGERNSPELRSAQLTIPTPTTCPESGKQGSVAQKDEAQAPTVTPPEKLDNVLNQKSQKTTREAIGSSAVAQAWDTNQKGLGKEDKMTSPSSISLTENTIDLHSEILTGVCASNYSVCASNSKSYTNIVCVRGENAASQTSLRTQGGLRPAVSSVESGHIIHQQVEVHHPSVNHSQNASRNSTVAETTARPGSCLTVRAEREKDSTISTTRAPSHRTRRIQSRTTLMMFVLTAFYILNWLPHLTLRYSRKLPINWCDNFIDCGYNIPALALRSYYINNAINVFVYSVWSVRFRDMCRNLFYSLTRQMKGQ